MMIFRLITVLIILLVPALSFAGDGGQESVFSEGAGARSLALGGAFASIADDASAVYYNPAGLATLEYQEFSIMHMDLYEGTIYNFAGWVYPDIKLGGFGISYFRLGTDDIIKRVNYIETGKFNYAVHQFIISYGKKIYNNFAFGINFKILHQNLDEFSDNSYGMDIGFKSEFTKHISYGLIIRDFVSPKLELDKTTESIPLSYVTGFSIEKYPLTNNLTFTTALEVEKFEDRDLKFHSGAELIFDTKYAVRAGYNKDNFTFGAGVNINRLKIDYAFELHDYLENSHRFSLSFLFGLSTSEKIELIEQRDLEKGTTLLEDERKRQFEFYKNKADDFYNSFRLDSSLAYYQRALAFDENNEEIIGTIAAIEKSMLIEAETRRQLEQKRSEINTLVSTYYNQAVAFYAKKYYQASLDMLDLIFDIDIINQNAVDLKEKINAAVSNEIAEKLTIARQAEESGNIQLALESYSRIMELDPNNQEVKDALLAISKQIDLAQQLNKGIDEYNKLQFDKARSTFLIVISIDKDNSVAKEYLKKLNTSDAASTTLEDIQKNKEVWQWYLDGLRFMRDKEYQKAIDAWNEVLKVFPNNTNTINNIEQAQLRLKSEESE